MNNMLPGATANGPTMALAQLAAAAGPAQPSFGGVGVNASAQQSQRQPMAEPLHIQRLEAALNMRPFMEHARYVLSQPLSSGDDSNASEDGGKGGGLTENSDDEVEGAQRKRTRRVGTKEERQNVKMHLFNFNDLTNDREWLYEVLLSDTDTETEISDEDDYVKELLKTHIFEQRHRENFYKKPTNNQYAYYGAGMLSNHDMFPEHQQSIVGVRKRRRRTKKEKPLKPPKLPKDPKVRKPRKPKLEQPEPGEVPPSELNNYAFGDTSAVNDDDDNLSDEIDSTLDGNLSLMPPSGMPYSGRGRRRKSQQHRTPEVMAARRRRVWQLMAKKELGRCQRAKANNHKEVVQNCKRVATMCSKVVRQRATISQKVMKETVWRAKRLTREMMGYWKRYERVERDTRRRMEREAEEQRKMDVEIIEAKRQQRKLNFLITQTELYAHFMSKKLGQGTEEEQLRILNQLDEEINPRLAAYDDYDAEHYKSLAQKNAELAFTADSDKAQRFDVTARLKQEKHDTDDGNLEQVKKEVDDLEMPLVVAPAKADVPPPEMFKGTLKTYQLKGVTWLANLYDQGISGILADEMGLGKTVQSIAFLCHVAERYGVWGPFLIISPASTLHNWQQEMQRFAPDFNVVPYWGSPNERKILRQFWEQKDLHTREASFHVVITSYQLIVSDYKYFNRIKWQYMILDEAQAIKSASSMRWKLLLGFNCRNRLLLSGTPIQNSMAELWALLHFIMPTLFDSHDEFNEWFSKDIESHAENKTGIDEKQISRLHMILKPFMLRRIKKDVENELSDKIEIMVYCPLTIRQKLLYIALKKKIRIEDLLHFTGGGAGSAGDGHHFDKNFTSNLMNLVMQFRKVCNHPELFERRDAKSPFAMRCAEYVVPRLVYDECLLQRSVPSKRHLLYNRFSIFKAAYLQQSLFSERGVTNAKGLKSNENYARYVDLNVDDNCCFSFTRLCDLSPRDMEDVTINGLISYIQHYRRRQAQYALLACRRQWWPYYKATRFQLLEAMVENPLHGNFMLEQSVLRNFVFSGVTTQESTIYAFGNYKTVNIQETIEHRVIRSKHDDPTKKSSLEMASFDESITIKSELDLDTSEDATQMSSTPTSSKSQKSTSKHKDDVNANVKLLPEFPHVPRAAVVYQCEALEMPRFLYGLSQRVQAVKRHIYCESRAAAWTHIRHIQCENPTGLALVNTALDLCRPRYGWSSIVVPDKQTLVSDAGKLAVLDSLLTRLKAQGHRVLIYSQMTKMIDLLEEYMWHRKHRYMRLDGSSKISARRDMVADFQTREDIFVFLLSTRAGGLGINLTAADTVIFYDSDWNPTVDQQAMDRAHRLGQTKQVTVYRLICKGTIEERILQRAREKSEIQRMVISGGNFKPDTLKPKEVVSLLLDDEEIELKYRQKVDPDAPSSSQIRDVSGTSNDKKRHRNPNKQSSAPSQPGGITIPAGTSSIGGEDANSSIGSSPAIKRPKLEAAATNDDDSIDVAATSGTSSPSTSAATATGGNMEPFVPGATTVSHNDDSDNEALIVDCESPLHGADSPTLFGDYGNIGRIRRRHYPRGTKRGRPRGSTRRGGGNGSLGRSLSSPGNGNVTMLSTPRGEDSAHSTSLSNLGTAADTSFSPTVPTPVKRGPGRPRLKTAGPTYLGTRGAPRTRKPIGPLVVPLGHSPGATPLSRSRAPSPSFSERSSYSATGSMTIGTPQAGSGSGSGSIAATKDVGASGGGGGGGADN